MVQSRHSYRNWHEKERKEYWNNNNSSRKVAKVNVKDQLDTRSKIKSIRTYFMQLTADPKLLCEGGGVKDDAVAVCDRVSGAEKSEISYLPFFGPPLPPPPSSKGNKKYLAKYIHFQVEQKILD